jgi:hypothetical protein
LTETEFKVIPIEVSPGGPRRAAPRSPVTGGVTGRRPPPPTEPALSRRPASSTPTAASSAGGVTGLGARQPWELTPQKAFRPYILASLNRHGGEAHLSRILSHVEAEIEHLLTKANRETVDRGDPLAERGALGAQGHGQRGPDRPLSTQGLLAADNSVDGDPRTVGFGPISGVGRAGPCCGAEGAEGAGTRPAPAPPPAELVATLSFEAGGQSDHPRHSRGEG